MTNRRSKYFGVTTIMLAIIIFLQAPIMAQDMVSISFPIVINTKVTTHPDTYSTQTQMLLKMTSPVVCDLDCDYYLDIVCAGFDTATNKSRIFVWKRNGALKDGWPVEIDGKVETSPAVGDLDGDGDLEIIVSVSNIAPQKGGKVYVWHHDGDLYDGYPINVSYKPGAPLVGDLKNDFSEEPLVYDCDMGMALCDIDLDGKKEIILASPYGMDILNGDAVDVEGWPVKLLTVGTPVAGDVDGDGKAEVFLAVKTPDANYVYGWDSEGNALEGWPVNCAGVVNAPGNFLSIADINGDGISEILSGSTNGWLIGCNLNGTVAFSVKPSISEDKAETNEIYQPIIGDINNDDNMEILATSRYGNIYCYDNNGNPVNGWPIIVNYELSKGAVLVDIESDSLGDVLNPANDLELLVSGGDGAVHSIDLPGDFNPGNIQWGMSGFNSRNGNNYLRDWDAEGWSVFDADPVGASINVVYDWNRGGRVIELDGAGLNNGYSFKNENGTPLNSKNTTLQWSMLYSTPFYIYVSVDTIKGKRYLMYTPTEGNQLADPTGVYIHHGLGGDAKNGRWHTFNRQLVQDLKDADPTNEIIDVNAVYIQGSGKIDDLLLISGTACVDLLNSALTASVSVSSGSETAPFINDGDPSTKWVSGGEAMPWIKYSWENPQEVNRIVLKGVTGTDNGLLFITDAKGNVYEVAFVVNGTNPIEIVFQAIDDVKSIVAVFDGDNGAVSVSEIEVYNDPNVEDESAIPQVVYSADDYMQMKDGYLFDPILNDYWLPHGIAYVLWNNIEDQWQTPINLKNDMQMMYDAGVNAIRVDFAWKNIVTEDGGYDYSKYDLLLEEAQAHAIKVMPVINYEGAPWLNIDVLDLVSDAAVDFSDFIKSLVSRYYVGGDREDLGDVIAAWIVGDFYNYINTSVWNEQNLLSLIALAVNAVKDVDPDHLVSYESLAANNNNLENALQIVEKCIDSGVPLDFWSIDFYPELLDVNNLITSKVYIENAISASSLPVLVAKTGISSTDTSFSGVSEERQAKLICKTILESFTSGAVGVFVYNWKDSVWKDLAEEERGYGLINNLGDPKPSYNGISDVFSKIDSISLNELLPQLVGTVSGIVIDTSLSVVVNHRSTANNQMILLGFSNYNEDQSGNTALVSTDFIGMTLEDIINDVVIDDSLDQQITQEIEADGYKLLLAYIDDAVTDSETSNESNSGSSNDSSGAQGSSSSSAGDNSAGAVSSAASAQTSGATTSSSQTGSGSTAGSSTSGSSSGSSQATPSTTTSLASQVSSAGSNQLNVIGAGGVGVNTDEDEEGTNPGSSISGDKSNTSSNASGSKSNIRTYIGGDNTKKDKNSSSNDTINNIGVDTNLVMPNEVSPLEQFQAIMEQNADRELGVTRMEPQIVPQAKVEDIIKSTPAPALQPAPSLNMGGVFSALVAKAKDFWNNLFRSMKVASKILSSHRYV